MSKAIVLRTKDDGRFWLVSFDKPAVSEISRERRSRTRRAGDGSRDARRGDRTFDRRRVPDARRAIK